VDLILAKNSFEPVLAIEIKSQTAPQSIDCSGFQPFGEEYPTVPKICVCNTPRAYVDNEIRFVPWKEMLKELT
jgi:hypothetical protein